MCHAGCTMRDVPCGMCHAAEKGFPTTIPLRYFPTILCFRCVSFTMVFTQPHGVFSVFPFCGCCLKEADGVSVFFYLRATFSRKRMQTRHQGRQSQPQKGGFLVFFLYPRDVSPAMYPRDLSPRCIPAMYPRDVSPAMYIPRCHTPFTKNPPASSRILAEGFSSWIRRLAVATHPWGGGETASSCRRSRQARPSHRCRPCCPSRRCRCRSRCPILSRCRC